MNIIQYLKNNEKLSFIRLLTEDELSELEKEIKSYLSGGGETKTYRDCIEIYDQFCKSYIGVTAKIDGAEGKAMKSIISYLKNQDKIKSGESKVEDAWKFILGNWDKLDNFLKGQVKIRQINSNFSNILNQIRNASKTTSRGSAIDNEIAKRINRQAGY